MANERFKFRVWSKKYNAYLKDREYPVGHSDFYISQEGTIFEDSGPVDEWDPNPPCRFGNPDYIVEQCTGQNAMSGGGLIFEGDLVDVYNPLTDAWNRCVVKWENDASGYVCLYVNPDTVEKGCFLASASGTYFDGGYCRIVGNIHEGAIGVDKAGICAETETAGEQGD